MQYFSDDNTVCVSNTTYGSDDGTITTKEYNAAYADKCAPLITNIAEFGDPVPLLRNTQHTEGKAIV